MPRPQHRSAVTAFAAEPTSATAARRFVRQTLNAAEIAPAIRDRAELIVSELVTNAVLHAGTGPIVSVRIDSENVRIEVEDTSPTAPVLREYGLDASTGRGLRVVSNAAAEWGVETTSGGKAVWATLPVDATSIDDSRTAPLLSHKASEKSPPNALDQLDQEQTYTASFRNIPVRLYLQLEAHNESLVREFSLLAIQVNGDEAQNIPSDLRRAIVASTTLDIRFSILRISARAAMQDGRHTFSSDIELTKANIENIGRYGEWVQRVDALSAQKLLLTSPPTEPVRHLREWLIRETFAQVETGAKPSAYQEDIFHSQ